jgi:type IV secretion system protein TrbL
MLPMAENGQPCEIWNVGCQLGDGVKNLAGSALEQVADGVVEAFGKAVAWLGTFWVKVDTPPLISSGTAASSEVEFLQGHLWFWTLALAVMAVLIGAGRMVWEQRGEPLRQVAIGLVRFILVSAGGVAVIQLLITASDGLAKWLIDEATAGTGFGTNLMAMISLNGQVGVILVIVLGLFAAMISLLQLVLMVFRSGLLVVLAGVFPTTAAFTNTEMGRQWFQRCVGWIIAFILYKPAAALVYATAFKLTSANVFGKEDDGTGGVKILAGLGLMFVALIALPALMRFVTPMVGAVAGGGGGGAAMGAMAGSLASGAVSKGSFSGGSRSGGHKSGSASTTGNSPAEKGPKGAPETASKPGQGGGGTNPAKGASTAGTAAKGASTAGAGAGAGAAAAAGPVGVGVAAAASVAKKGAEAAKGAAESSTGEGPSGSKG